MTTTSAVVRVAAVGDIHYSRASRGAVRLIFENINERADILVLCGDLTDYGLPEEAQELASDLRATVSIPIIAVLGNHDFESGQADEVRQVMTDAGVTMLQGDSCEIKGVGFAGVKGFAGGFGRGALGPWGEPTIKAFVNEALSEALQLETALARLRTPHRIAVLHYAPIQATVEGEPPAIFPWLGSSRLEEPLNRLAVTAVVHGHAHHGAPEGRTSAGLPVYNVSLSLMRETFPDQAPYRILELPVVEEEASAAATLDGQIEPVARVGN